MGLMSLEFCVFYIFAVIGIYCFGGSITKDIALLKLQTAVGNENVDDIAFWEYIRDSFYYDNNMNFIANTLLVMLELTVVNQWHAITRMYIEITSPWAYIYFYSFYFVSVLIVTNVLTAFIFDAFIIQFEINTNNRLELEKNRQRKQTIEKTRRLKKEKEIQFRA